MSVIAIFVVMIAVGGLLTLSSGNVLATSRYGDQARTVETASGAIEVAANGIRQSLLNNSAGQHCFPDSTGSLTAPGSSDILQLSNLGTVGGVTYSAAVRCDHTGGSSSPVLINSQNRPGMAILTLGGSTWASQGEPGISVKALNATPFKVHGVIYSNSTLEMVQGSLLDDNGVYAKGACTNPSSVTPTPNCNFSGAVPDGSDPGYAQPAAVPSYQGSAAYGATTLPFDQPPPNACKNTVVTFQPGYYDDASALSKIMSSSGCAGSTFWFTPGTYYFDFHDGDDPALSPASHVWSVNTGSLVAGTPVSPSGTVLSAPPLTPTIPGSCQSPIKVATAQGVQFVFGGDSQLIVDAAKAEICGTYSATTPPIAVYGATSGSETTTTAAGISATTTASTAFTNPDNAKTADGTSAQWNNTASGSQTGTLTLTGLQPPSPAPVAGVHVDSATVTVVHGNSNGQTNDVDKITVTMPDASTIDYGLSSYGDSAMHTDVIDLRTNSTFTSYVHKNGLPGPLTVTYSAKVKHKDTEKLDAVTLRLSYRNPAYRSEDTATINGSVNCLTRPYTGGGGSGCAALTSTQAPSNQFYIQGTTYAPKAALDVALNQATSQVFKFGVVARSLTVKVTGSSTFDQPVIEIPDDSPGAVVSTNVILSAFVCEGAGPCGTSGTPALRSRVALIDPDPGSVVLGLRALNVQSWSEPPRTSG